MGASIDEHKPFLAYGGRPHPRSNNGSPLQQWVRRRWPLLLAASLGGLYLLRAAFGPSAPSEAGSARLSSGGRVKGYVVCVFGGVGR